MSKQMLKELAYENTVYCVPEYLNNGRYRVINILSRGGMGVIYNAVDTHLHNKKVLIKSLLYRPSIFANKKDLARNDEIEKLRYLAENERIALLYAWERKIGSVPVLLDYFEDFNPQIYGPHRDQTTGEEFTIEEDSKNDPYIVLNYFAGKPITQLEDLSNENRSLIAKKVLVAMSKLLQAFHINYRMPLKSGEMANLQFIYCDLKPSNIIMTDDRRVVLIDFGSFVLKINEELQNEISTTKGYCAPEINEEWAGAVDQVYVSPCADCYSLGATLYEIITGKPPEYVERQNVFDFKLIESENNKWKAFLEKALATTPEDRFQDMIEMRNGYFSMVEKRKDQVPRKKTDIFKRFNLSNDKKTLINNYPDDWQHERRLFYSQKTYCFVSIHRLKRSFLQKAEAVHLTDQSVTFQGLSDKQQKMIMPFAQSMMGHIARILAKNINCLPELLSFDVQGNEYLITKSPYGNPFLPMKNQAPNELFLKKRISKIIDMFMELRKQKVIITHIDNEMVLFDSADQPFLYDYTTLINEEESGLLINPLIKVKIPEALSAPEIKDNGAFYDESYSYLTGKLVLGFLLKQKNIDYKLYLEKNPFPNKIELEEILSKTNPPGEIKAFLINALAKDRTQRSTLFELKRMLSGAAPASKSKTVYTKTKKPTKPILVIHNQDFTKDYIVNFKGVYNDITLANKQHMFFESLYLLPSKPTGKFLDMLKAKKLDYVVYDNDKTALLSCLENVIEKSKPSGYVALFLGKSVTDLKDIIIRNLKDFKNTTIFAPVDHFSGLQNVVYYNAYHYLNRKKKGKK